MRNLSEIRTEIDSIDEQIIELFKKRNKQKTLQLQLNMR